MTNCPHIPIEVSARQVGDSWLIECSNCGPLEVSGETEKEITPKVQLHLMEVHGAPYEHIYHKREQ